MTRAAARVPVEPPYIVRQRASDAVMRLDAIVKMRNGK